MTALTRPISTVGRVFEYRLLTYRRTYRASLFSSFLSPVLFLTAMGLGLGSYVSNSASLGGVPYLVFLAPGLLAATAMQTASFEATFPIMGGLIWNKVFHAHVRDADLAARHRARQPRLDRRPADADHRDLHAGHHRVRGVPVAAGRPGIPAAVLTGMAFAGPIAAFSATQKHTRTGSRRSSGSGSRRCSCSPGRSSRSARCRRVLQVARLADAAVPRRRADPQPRRWARSREDPVATRRPRRLSRDAWPSWAPT